MWPTHKDFRPLARLAAETGRVVNTFETYSTIRSVQGDTRPGLRTSESPTKCCIAANAARGHSGFCRLRAENIALAAAAIRVPRAKNYTLMTGQIRHLGDMAPQVGLESTVKRSFNSLAGPG